MESSSFTAFFSFSVSSFKTQVRAQPNTAVPVCSILKSEFRSIGICLAFPRLGSVQHGQRLACPLGNLNPAWFSPGRPHCVILWLDGSARCPLPLTAQAGAACLLGILPVAPGQRVPYAYTDLFGCQGAQPFLAVILL